MAYLVREILELLSSILLHKKLVVAGVKKHVEQLTESLWTIKSELADAEKQLWKEKFGSYLEENQSNENSNLETWLGELNEWCYGMEDVLEEWSTAILKSELEHASNPEPKDAAASSCFGRGQAVSRNSSKEWKTKIKCLTSKLQKVLKEKGKFQFEKSIEQHVTVSAIEQPERVGRGKEKAEVIKLLCQDVQAPGHGVVSIVGHQGIGKTSLAQLVCDDKEVQKHFEKKIWVCVSNVFDKSRLPDRTDNFQRDISAPGKYRSVEEAIRDEGYYDSLIRKKFLLVLDDLHSVYDNMRYLRRFLKLGAPGSRILVTAPPQPGQSPDPSDDFGFHEFKLGQLSDEDCWLLLKQSAFFGRNDRECENLERLGREMARKCGGLPLAALALGGLLRFRKSKEDWGKVWHNEVQERPSSLQAVLRLCYYDLPSKMRRCFAYCAMFPPDQVLVKDELINLWMAQGYLRATQSKEMEMIGQEYFNGLAVRAFFHDIVRDEDGSIISCKMHDAVRKLAVDVSHNDFIGIKDNGSGEGGIERRHLIKREGDITENFFETETRLRSLIIDSENLIPKSFFNDRENLAWVSSIDLPSLFTKSTCLRTLKLRDSICDVSADIKKLIHLRYLDLSGNRGLKILPAEIYELHYLQTLDLSGCEDLKELPSGIGKLVNLRCLRIQGTRKVTFMPKGIERLSSLRTLDEFVVEGSSYNGKASTLGDLKNLNQLRKSLAIRVLGNKGDASEAKKALLTNMMYLTTLILNFDGVDAEGTNAHDELVIQALEPPSGLATLEINGYRGATLFPNFMLPLTQLSKLRLSNFKSCQQLPLLGQLQSLQYLEIKLMNRVEKVGHELLGVEIDGGTMEDKEETSSSLSSSSVIAFPKLKELKFSQMVKWKEWADSGARLADRKAIMPCLLLVQISDCPKLESLPIQLLHSKVLNKLSISKCQKLKASYHWENGKNWREISHIPIIEFDRQSCPKFQIELKTQAARFEALRLKRSNQNNLSP